MLTDAQRLAALIRQALDDSDVTDAEISRACGVTKQAVTGWRKTGRVAKKHLPTIARLTKKPVELFLLADPPVPPGKGEPQDEAPMVGGKPMTTEEQDLVLAFRALPEQKQTDLLGQLLLDAEQWRAYAEEVLTRHGAKGTVPNAVVAMRYGTPPAVEVKKRPAKAKQ